MTSSNYFIRDISGEVINGIHLDSIKMQHWEIFDGPLEAYIKHPMYEVTDFEGNIITEIPTK